MVYIGVGSRHANYYTTQDAIISHHWISPVTCQAHVAAQCSAMLIASAIANDSGECVHIAS